MALSESWLKANLNKERDKVFEKSDRDSLSVRATTKGKLVFQLRYRYLGKAKRCDLGSYPLMSLKEARAEAMRLRSCLENGQDPKVVKATELMEIAGVPTLEKLFNDWYDNYCTKHKQGHSDVKRSFELHIFPKLGKLPIDKIAVHIWLDILEELAGRIPGIADRILINAKQMYKWAVKRRVIEANPLADIYSKSDLKIKKNKTSRVLDDEELRMLWLAINKSRTAHKNRLFLKLCLYYGCRNGELRKSEKSHFDFEKGVWIVPPENHKTGKDSGRELIRPITPVSAEIIAEAMNISRSKIYTFSNNNNEAMMGHSAAGSLPYNLMQWLRKNKDYEMQHWSVHDLRRTVRTRLSALTSRDIAELMVGHTLPPIQGTYDYYDYQNEMRQAYEKWWALLMNIVK